MQKIKNRFQPKKIKVIVVALAVFIGGIASYSFTDNYFEISKNLDIFATLFRELNIYYVDETKPGDLMKTAIDDMLESLDPYTNYIPESDMEDFKMMTTGQYGGIGSLIRMKGDYVCIGEPYEGKPAQKADLRAGDLILEVNGVSAKGKKTDEVSKILKGQPGTSVTVLIQREGEKKPLEKTLVRAEIKVNSVTYSGMIDKQTGYIKLSGFTQNAGAEVKAALDSLKKNPNLKSLIFDLRGNPGGLLNEAVDIVNLFAEQGQEIVSTRGKIKDWDKSYKAINNPIDLETHLTVLVDRGSASASEIVSGAIQDFDRGVVIGQRTFGKGLVQQTVSLSYNAKLKVTVAKYYVPSGRCIQVLDYSHRGDDGGVDKVPDSLITAFKTKNGRIVYDGGGVAPDITTEQHKYANITTSLLSKSLIFDYATKYRVEHATIVPAKEFKLTDAEYNDFMAFLNSREKDYDYTTKSETTLEELKKIAEQEKYFSDVKTEFEALKVKIAHNKKADLIKFSDEIKEFLESEIASRYYYQKGRLETLIKSDIEIKKAQEILNDSIKYKSILTTIVKPEHPFNQEVLKREKMKSGG